MLVCRGGGRWACVRACASRSDLGESAREKKTGGAPSPRDAEHIANQAMARAVAAASAAAEALQAGPGAPETPAESQAVGAPRTDPTSTAMALQILAMAQGSPPLRQRLAPLDTNVGR